MQPVIRKGADLKRQDCDGKTVKDYIDDNTKKNTPSKKDMKEFIKIAKKKEEIKGGRDINHEKNKLAEELVSNLNALDIGEKKFIHNVFNTENGVNRRKLLKGRYTKDLIGAYGLIKQHTFETRDLALIKAIKDSNYKVVRLLLKSGVKPNIIDNSSDSALILAVKENAKVGEHLEQYRNKRESLVGQELIKFKRSEYYLEKKLNEKELSSLNIIAKLISKGARVNYKNNRELTPLYYAREYNPLLDKEGGISAGEIIMAKGGLSLEKEKINSLYGYDRVTQVMIASGIGSNDSLVKLISSAEKKGLDVKKMLLKGDRIGYNAYSFAHGGYRHFMEQWKHLNFFSHKKITDSYNIVKETLKTNGVTTGLDIRRERDSVTLGRWINMGFKKGGNIILSIIGNTYFNVGMSKNL